MQYVNNACHAVGLSAGSSKTNLAPALKRLISCAAVVVILAAAGLSQSVNLSSPGDGATVSSPVQVTVNANGGNYPVTAIWIYVDNQPVYKTSSSSVNTSLNLSPGSHHIVPVSWNTTGQAFVASAYVTVVNNPDGVNVSAPSGGATVSSPVQFTASASTSELQPPGPRVRCIRTTSTRLRSGSPSSPPRAVHCSTLPLRSIRISRTLRPLA